MESTLLFSWIYLRHLPLSDLYESLIFLSWSLSTIHMVPYLKKHKNHLCVITAAIVIFTKGFPDLAVKARCVGGSTHQVPIEIGFAQGKALVTRWLLRASRKCPGQNMTFKLSSKLVDAAKGSGDAIRGFIINELIMCSYESERRIVNHN